MSGGAAALIPPGWKLDRTEVVIPGRIVLAVIQDRYSTIGLLSVYLHPQTKFVKLKELIAWVKTSKVDFSLYMGGDFNQVDTSCPDLWNELLVHAASSRHASTTSHLRKPYWKFSTRQIIMSLLII